MNEDIIEQITDLQMKRAISGLDENEGLKLESLLTQAGIIDDESFEIAAAAVGLVDLNISEPLPQHLRSKILASADEFFAGENVADFSDSNAAASDDGIQQVISFGPARRSWNWLGWAFAGVAIVALTLNIWFTRVPGIELANTNRPPATPETVSAERGFELLLASATDITRADWKPGNVKDLTGISGDVIWSDEKQSGYMRFRGLPVNDKSKETYQLWIFDKTQDKATPIDGGTFDVNTSGEVIIPIDAKLNARGPELFAVTIEKPGGVVVSKREKIAALATVDTKKLSAS